MRPRPVPTVPELAPYQDEPRQAPAGRAAKTGMLDLRFEDRGTRSVLSHVYREAPLLVQQALYWDEAVPGLPCVYIVSTSGCVLQGDRLHVDIEMGPGAMAHVTTQSATKVHAMDANFAAQLQTVSLAGNSYLELMPAMTIPHRRSRFYVRTDITIAPSATLLFSEIVMPGRKHHGGEMFEYDLYSATVTAARPGGGALFTEKLLVEPPRRSVRSTGVMRGFDVLANVVLLTPRKHWESVLDRIASGRSGRSVVAGASRLPHDAGLVYKVLGPESAPVRAHVRDFWSVVRDVVLGKPVPPMPLWG
ncbi:urease accessory protein UreD [Rhodococcus sp. SGAir0479]|uniref:urease accessory protein UreD n=1 Tax=Rhodococcus sp. SGAir0479 TaxID=2567884 RepID=UPI002672A6DE|nr:urease accessory protein UreD [Rhodococcus sp. SGAir0479]